MVSPRETPNSNLLEPLGPNFARLTTRAGAAQEKYPTVDDQYNDITRQPTRDAGAGVTVIMDVPAPLRRQRVKLENAVITLTAANDYGSLKLVDLPDRNIMILQAELTGTVIAGGDFATNDDPKIGVGTVAASANPIATTAVNVIPLTDYTNIVAGAATAVAQSLQLTLGTDASLLIPDAAAQAIYLNASNTDTQLAADGTLTFNGYFDFWYIDLGNVGS